MLWTDSFLIFIQFRPEEYLDDVFKTLQTVNHEGMPDPGLVHPVITPELGAKAFDSARGQYPNCATSHFPPTRVSYFFARLFDPLT